MKRVSRENLEVGKTYYISNHMFKEELIVTIMDDTRVNKHDENGDTVFKLRHAQYRYIKSHGKVESNFCMKGLPILKFDRIYELQDESEILGIIL